MSLAPSTTRGPILFPAVDLLDLCSISQKQQPLLTRFPITKACISSSQAGSVVLPAQHGSDKLPLQKLTGVA